MKKTVFMLAAALLLGLAIAPALSQPVAARSVIASPLAAAVAVSIIDNEYSPKVVNVSAGDTITWTNNGKRPHTVTASDGSWTSGNLAPGATFSRTIDGSGTIGYYCEYHGTPTGQGHAGSIVVAAAQVQPPAASPTTMMMMEASPTTMMMMEASPTTMMSSGGDMSGSTGSPNLPATGAAASINLWLLMLAAMALAASGLLLRGRTVSKKL